MSKKLILFLMVLLFGSTSFLRADEVQIGEGTANNSYLPSYSLYNYSLTQQIYTADEIGVGAGTITSIAFYNDGTEKTRDYDVYLVNTDKAAFDGTTDWITVAATDKYFSGSVTMVAGAWTTITLDASFAYTGANLAVIMDDNSGTWSGGMKGLAFAAENQAIRVYSDPTNYDPTNPSSYTGTIEASKNQIVLNITPSGPAPTPTPTGDLTITPNPWDLGQRPTNGWMEPYAVRILNEGPTAVVEGSMSNTSGVTPFALSTEINQTLETDAAIDFEVNWNAVADGEYTEEFTLFYAETRDIVTVPVTATLYTAGEADIVETAKTLSLSYTSGVANFSHTPANLHANYLLAGMTEMKTDAVYKVTIAKDSKVTVNNKVAFYTYVATGFNPTAAIEPVFAGEANEEVTVLAGTYYMIVTGDAITTVEGTVEQIAAPEELVALTPEDGATGLDGDILLTWEGGANATQYQVLFG